MKRPQHDLCSLLYMTFLKNSESYVVEYTALFFRISTDGAVFSSPIATLQVPWNGSTLYVDVTSKSDYVTGRGGEDVINCYILRTFLHIYGYGARRGREYITSGISFKVRIYEILPYNHTPHYSDCGADF